MAAKATHAVKRPLRGKVLLSGDVDPRVIQRVRRTTRWVSHNEDGYWEVPRTRFREAIEEVLARYGEVHVYEEWSRTQQCDTRCQAAKGPECVCSCHGTYHGAEGGAPRVRPVGETTLVVSEGVEQTHYRLVRGQGR